VAVRSSTRAELTRLTRRVGRGLARQGLLTEDGEGSLFVADSDEAGSLPTT
jgi:L-aminopeptidase/D-esterase-like protein